MTEGNRDISGDAIGIGGDDYLISSEVICRMGDGGSASYWPYADLYPDGWMKEPGNGVLRPERGDERS